MLIAQLFGGFDDLGDRLFAREQGEEEAVCGFGGRDDVEELHLTKTLQSCVILLSSHNTLCFQASSYN